MTLTEWTAVGGLAVTSLTAVYGLSRFVIKSIMRELTPNGGSSLKDQVNRIEDRLEWLVQKMID